MSKTLKKFIVMIMTCVLVVTSLQITSISANANISGTLTHNLSAKQIPNIYFFPSKEMRKMTENHTDIPEETTHVYLYILPTVIDIDEENTKITVDGKEVAITWSNSNSYRVAMFKVSSTKYNDVDVKIAYSNKRNFSLRARKIITNNPNQDEMEKIIKEHPATYELYNEDTSIMFKGTINTAINSNTNFVHWTQVKGNGNYVTGDDTHISNLPNGEYTLIETDSGGILKTENKTSSQPWLNSSFMKENNGKKYYTFSVTDASVNEWMDACLKEGQANQIFFGFYLEELKTSFNVSFNGNGNNQGKMDTHTKIKGNEKITLYENKYLRDGYTFTGWNTVSAPTTENPGISYADKAEMTVTEDTILFAQWKKNLNIAHEILIQDNSKTESNLQSVGTKTSIISGLAYTQDELDTILKENLTTGYKHIETKIEVKNHKSDIWETYRVDTEIKDKSQVRYVIVIDKDLQQTKEIAYTVEYWLYGDTTPKDTQTVTSKIWINETNTNLNVEEILLNKYEGYKFSHYNPEQLPKETANGSVIIVYYGKVETPAIPVEPTEPEIPTIPDVPTKPEIPSIPVTPITPTIPVTPTVVVNPIAPVFTPTPLQNNVTPVENTETVTIEEEQPPLGNGETEIIEDEQVPLASGDGINGAWALVNLICVILTALVGLFLVLLKHSKEEENEDKEDRLYVRRRWMKVLSIVIAIASLIVFILTENIFLPMFLVDEWTLAMVAIALVQVVVYFIARRYKSDDENEEQKVVYN